MTFRWYFFFLEGERRNDGTPPPPPPFFPNLDQRTNLLLGSQKTWRLFKMKLCWKKQEMNYEGLYFFVAKNLSLLWCSSGRSWWCGLLPGCQPVTSRMTPYMFRILGIPKKAQKMPLLLGGSTPKVYSKSCEIHGALPGAPVFVSEYSLLLIFFFDQFPPISHPNCWWKVR